MKNKLTKYGMMIVAAVLFIAVLGAGAASADTPEGMTGSNWMSFLPDTVSLWELNIPGSHDSAGYHVNLGNNENTQTLTPVKQFDAGCRWFDVHYAMRASPGKATVDGVEIKTLKDGNGDGKDVHVMMGPTEAGLYCYIEEDTSEVFSGTDDKIMLFENLINDLSAKVAGTQETAIVALETTLGAGDGLEDMIIDEIKCLTGKKPNHFAWCWDNKVGFDNLTLGNARGKVVFVFKNHYSETVPSYMDGAFATEDTKTTEKAIATQYARLAPVWDQSPVQNYSQSLKLNASSDPKFASPVVAFTNCRAGSLAAQEDFMADEISSGRFYTFIPGKKYGVVIFNFIDNEAAKTIYELNNFGGKVEKPVPNTPLTYTGNPQSPIVSGAGYTLSGNVSETNASSTYKITVSVNTNNGYTWSDGTTDPVTYEWEILPLEVTQPELNATSYSYTGSAQSVELVPENQQYESSGTFTAKDVGMYTVNVSLTDKKNTVWANTESSAANLTLTWSILPTVAGELPKLVQNKFVYTGSEIKVNVTNTTAFKVVANDTATGVGIYLANVTLQPGYTWQNYTGDYVLLPWVIVPRNITVPDKLVENTFVFNGSKQQVVLNTTKPEEITNYTIVKEGNATAAGTYHAVVKLNDPRNNSWKLDDGKITKIPRVYQWNITPYVEEIPQLYTSTCVYDRSSHTPIFTPESGNWTSSGNLTETGAGSYKIEVGLNSVVNYTWDDGTTTNKTLFWNITPKQITRPTVTDRVQIYDGSSKSSTITPVPSEQNGYTADNNSFIKPGVYLANISLIDSANTTWKDPKSTRDIRIPWMIRDFTVTINYAVNNASLGYLDKYSKNVNVDNQEVATGSTASVNSASPDTVFLYWNRTVGPVWDETETYVTLSNHVTPLVLPGDTALNYLPVTYTANFGPNKMDLGVFYLPNRSSYVFGIHEGALTNRASGLVDRISLVSIKNVMKTEGDYVYRNATTVTNLPVATSGYTSQVLSIFNASVQKNASIVGSEGNMTFVVGIKFNNEDIAKANAGNVIFSHQNNDNSWSKLKSGYSYGNLSTGLVQYVVETPSFSPIAITLETQNPTPSPSGGGSSHSGGTTLLADTSTNMCEVNFNMNGHGAQVTNQTVSLGNTADEPYPAPTADGYTFNGWYTNKGLTSKYAFSTPVTDDIELYAGWTANLPNAPAANPTTQPTQKSPAPFLGILVGLGAAALVLARTRR